jgi:hypothetical protein
MAGPPATPPSDAGFEVVRKGYDQGQVDAHMRRLDAELSILVTDRDAALAQAVQLAKELDEVRVRAESLRAQVRTLASPQQSPLNTSERIRSMLRLAEDEVTDMLARAEAEANRRRQEADQASAQTIGAARADAAAVREEGRAAAAKLRHELAQERAAFDQERAAGLERLAADRLATDADIAARTEAAEDERARLWAASETRRKAVEEDFTIAMEQRRAEALAALAAEQDAAHRDLENLRESAAARARDVIAHAEGRARTMIDEAERRVAELATVRARIAEQLTHTRAMLEETIGAASLRPEDLVGARSLSIATHPDGAVSANGANPSRNRDGADRAVADHRPESADAAPDAEPEATAEAEVGGEADQPTNGTHRSHFSQRRRANAGAP